MLEGIFLTRIIVFWYLAMQTIEMFTNYVLRSNWIDFVAVIGALSVFVLASAWGKVKGEQSYYNKSEWIPDEPMILDKDTESTESNEVVG